VVGYMVSGTLNTYILIQSDWPKLSRRVIAHTEANNDGGDEDSSSSSSSSSNSSSDGTESHKNKRVNRGSKRSIERAETSMAGEIGGDAKSLPKRRTHNGGDGTKSVMSNDSNRPVPGDLILANASTCSMTDDLTSTFESMANSFVDFLVPSPKSSQARKAASKW
jgi:hypothetical protein